MRVGADDRRRLVAFGAIILLNDQIIGNVKASQGLQALRRGYSFRSTAIGEFQPTGSSIMRALVLLLAFLIGLASPAFAADDIAAAQTIIRSQVEAFGHDDAAAAYSYAAPGIQGMFSQADTFLFMVQHSYAPVYRHKSFEFGEAQVADGKVAQRVHIIDADGVPWEALYTLEPQSDGSLKITGCVLLRIGQGA
jgi:hypothetical protein